MAENNNNKLIAAIRIRGERGLNPQNKETLESLNLRNQHNLVILDSKPSIIGMLKKSKDYITWGELDSSLLDEIKSKKGESKIYRLSPPKGGFERKGIKQPFSVGGVLGYRGEAINALIRKML
jgi:large subunit ribosomal protein L30